MSLKSFVCGGGGGGGPVGGDRDSISAFAIGTGIGVAGLWLYSWRQSSHVSPNALSYLPIALVRKNSFSKIPPKALVTAEAAEVARQRQASTEILAAQQAKHPQGYGMELKKIDTKITDVQMFPVSHLGDFYEGKHHENHLGNGVNHDYNQKLGPTAQSDLILGDIVRKPSMPPFSRAFIRAGPRVTLYFDPRRVKAAIVTCGGLCPGLNNIIREVTNTLLNLYGAESVLGVRGGYWGFHPAPVGRPPVQLTVESVAGIQKQGGTILGSSRGGLDLEKIFAFCRKHGVSQLYVVGGDGTHRAAHKIGQMALESRLQIAVAGIPKTIDNDLDIIDRSFGFNSAVAAAQDAIRSAKTEAQCNLPNGIGIVKLMGRHAGFIAAHATLAFGEVDLCLIPEVPIELEGTYGCLEHIGRVLKQKGHAVIVVAEGAGEVLIGTAAATDAGGNRALPEIGPFIKEALSFFFQKRSIETTIKYIDPSYMIRSVPANASDSLFCMLLAQNAVHGAMAGYTCFTTGIVCNRTVYIPIPAMVKNSPRVLDKVGRTWERVVSVTGQPNRPLQKQDQSQHAVQPATIF